MALRKKFEASAAIPPNGRCERTSYRRIGTLFEDTGTGLPVLKIDTLPLPESGWQGWVNFRDLPSPKTAPEDDEPF